MRKIACILGEAPGSGVFVSPLRGRTGAALARLADVDHGYLERNFVLRNLLQEFPGRRLPTDGRGAKFPPGEARAAAKKFRTKCSRVILLGKRVAAAFRFDALPCVWVRRNDRLYAMIPHPSPLNKWYKSEDHKATVELFFSNLINTADWPSNIESHYVGEVSWLPR